MPDTPTLDTSRFTLRAIERGDEAALFPTLSDAKQCRYLTRPEFASEEELAGWLFEEGWNGRTWIAHAKDGSGIAGRFVAMPGHEDGVAEIGYITVADRQGQGIARECSEALVRYLIEGEGHRKIIAEVDVDNTASIRLLERLGFEREAHLREHETTHIGLRDVLLYGLLASRVG